MLNAITSSLFEKSLHYKYSGKLLNPDLIVILSGGYQIHEIEEMDRLTSITRSRVIEGTKIWMQSQKSTIIMSGAEILKNRPISKSVYLMRKEAEISGVPSNMIKLDSLSINTWEHPEKIRNLDFVDSNMVIGIVTSKWHMRRAIYSFKRYFKNVIPLSLSSSLNTKKDINFFDFIPYPQFTSKTTLMLQEWIAIYWYKLKGLVF